ncbi:MAG: hypothetical protein KDK37_06005 [Leptospiraceae bacterium]|nr:hypothetical protein [Leptospiraceae bacterium]MCB1303808.1 hypothetical protein [Leptospiraceae bacterium]
MNHSEDSDRGITKLSINNHSALFFTGVIITILILWNGVCDYIYGYSAQLSGLDYFSPAVLNAIQTADGRPHWLLMMGQTAGWLYPLYALTYFNWFVGMRRAGKWLAHIPILLLTYAVLMIGGIQHAGWAFLSVLEQARSVAGSQDPVFFAQAQRFIMEHFVVGDLTAMIALYAGTIWHAVGVLSGRTSFPRWFVVFSPLGALSITMLVGVVLPGPIAGFVLAPFGTWFLLIPNVASALWLKNQFLLSDSPLPS